MDNTSMFWIREPPTDASNRDSWEKQVEELVPLGCSDVKIKQIQMSPSKVHTILERMMDTKDTIRLLQLWGCWIGDVGTSALSQILPELTGLRVLRLWGNNIGDAGAIALARVLPEIKHLSELQLNYNNIGDTGAAALAGVLPKVCKISELQLGNNKFGELGAEALARVLPFLGELSALGGVDLCNHVSVLGLRPDFASKDNTYILSYLRLLNSDELVPCHRVKMLILGPGEAGKTTLVHRLISGEFNKDQFSTTHGVEMREWHRNDITFSCWDLGGQETYLNTHPLFFTTRSIYVTVFNARANDEAKVDSFLRQILATCSSDDLPPVLVVGTRGKEVSPVIEYIMLRWRGVYPNIVGYHHVDSSDGSGICALSDALEALALTLPYVTEKVPLKCKKLENSLQVLRTNNASFCLSREAFVDLGKHMGFTEEQSLLTISLFHHWGVIHELPVCVGGDIVLRPQALADVFSCVIHARDPHPVLNHTSLDKIWPEFDEQLHCQFLALMHECNLAYPLFSSDGAPIYKSLVPALLVDDYELLSLPDVVLHSRFFPDIRSDLIYPTIRISYKNTPDRFFPMLHCRLHHMVALDGMWKHCMFLSRCVGSSSSYAVLREVSVIKGIMGAASSYMEIVPAGTDMNCASEIMRVMRSLHDESFCGMELQDVSVWWDGMQLLIKRSLECNLRCGQDILEYKRDDVLHRSSQVNFMPLQPFSVLFPEFDVTNRSNCEINELADQPGSADDLATENDAFGTEVERSRTDVEYKPSEGDAGNNGTDHTNVIVFDSIINEESVSKHSSFSPHFGETLIEASSKNDAKSGDELSSMIIEECSAHYGPEHVVSGRLNMLQQYYNLLATSSKLTKLDCRVNLVRHLVMYSREFLSEMRADHRLSALWVIASSENECAYYLMALSAVDHDSGLSVERESVIRIHSQSHTNPSFVMNAAVCELLLSCLEILNVELPVIEGHLLKWSRVYYGSISAYSDEMLGIEESFFSREYVGNSNYMSYSKHHLMQQRGMRNIEEEMRHMRDIIRRVDITTQRMEAQLLSVDMQLQEVLRMSQSQVNMLRSLLKGEQNMPQLLFAVEDDKWHIDRMFCVHLRLFCVCPVTLRVASSGNNGKGWKLKVLRSEVVKILPILKVGVVLLQVAAKLGLGLNLRIPLPSLKNCRSLSDLVQQSSITINHLDVAESMNEMLSAIERGGDAGLPFAALSEVQRDYSKIHHLLKNAGVIDASTGRPKKAGLQFTTSSCDGTTAFVHADGLQRFHDKGRAAFITPILDE